MRNLTASFALAGCALLASGCATSDEPTSAAPTTAVVSSTAPVTDSPSSTLEANPSSATPTASSDAEIEAARESIIASVGDDGRGVLSLLNDGSITCIADLNPVDEQSFLSAAVECSTPAELRLLFGPSAEVIAEQIATEIGAQDATLIRECIFERFERVPDADVVAVAKTASAFYDLGQAMAQEIPLSECITEYVRIDWVDLPALVEGLTSELGLEEADIARFDGGDGIELLGFDDLVVVLAIDKNLPYLLSAEVTVDPEPASTPMTALSKELGLTIDPLTAASGTIDNNIVVCHRTDSEGLPTIAFFTARVGCVG